MPYTKFPNIILTGGNGQYILNSSQPGNTAVAMAACDAEPQCRAFTEFIEHGYPVYDLISTDNVNKFGQISTTMPTVNTYIQDFSQITKQQEDLNNQIQSEIKEIYHAPGTITANFDENYRATMMMGTIWAMLGTAVLYLAVAL